MSEGQNKPDAFIAPAIANTLENTQIGRFHTKGGHGFAAVNHVAKLLRSNVVTSTIVVAVTTTPDFYRAAIARNISWQQFSKNVVVSVTGVATGVAGWMGGAAAGFALGSVMPAIGNAAGAVVGDILGALAGGSLGSAGAKVAMDQLAEDDAKRMLRFVEEVVEELAIDYLLSEAEIKQLIECVKKKVDPAWLRSMYQVRTGADHDAARRAFAHGEFDEVCLEIAKKREKVTLPLPEQVQAQIDELANELLETDSVAGGNVNGGMITTEQAADGHDPRA
jgi:outer membrane lipoprotein SlyB